MANTSTNIRSNPIHPQATYRIEMYSSTTVSSTYYLGYELDEIEKKYKKEIKQAKRLRKKEKQTLKELQKNQCNYILKAYSRGHLFYKNKHSSQFFVNS